MAPSLKSTEAEESMERKFTDLRVEMAALQANQDEQAKLAVASTCWVESTPSATRVAECHSPHEGTLILTPGLDLASVGP